VDGLLLMVDNVTNSDFDWSNDNDETGISLGGYDSSSNNGKDDDGEDWDNESVGIFTNIRVAMLSLSLRVDCMVLDTLSTTTTIDNSIFFVDLPSFSSNSGVGDGVFDKWVILLAEEFQTDSPLDLVIAKTSRK